MFTDILLCFRDILGPLGGPPLLGLPKLFPTPAAVARCPVGERAVALPRTTAAGLSKNIQERFSWDRVGSVTFGGIPVLFA